MRVASRGGARSPRGARSGGQRPLVEVEDLVKVYPGGTRAVDGVSFVVREGEIFGFLGPNGAGKTTTIRILVTLLPKTSGQARVGGVEVDRDPERVRRMIGYAAQFIGVDGDLTAEENLVLQGRLHGVGAAQARRRAAELLELFDLTEVARRRAITFSGGMRRRLDLAQALVHDPPLLFLDEPTTGLDPQTRKALWRYLEDLRARGTTIFLTTQYLEEADRLCGRLAIIDRGRIVAEGSPAALKAELGGEVVTLTLPEDATEAERERARAVLERVPGLTGVKVWDRSLSAYVRGAGERLPHIVRRLDRNRVRVQRLVLEEPSLDDVFLKYTGERMRTEEGGLATSTMMLTFRGAARGRG